MQVHFRLVFTDNFQVRRLFFLSIWILNFSWVSVAFADEATLGENADQSEGAVDMSTCDKPHDLEKLLSDRDSLLVHCSPVIASVGVTSGSAVATKVAQRAATTRVGKYVVSQASKSASAKVV